MITKTKSPAFPFNAVDYLSDMNVNLMSFDQQGAYIRLLSYCWIEGSLPKDQGELSKLCKDCPKDITIAGLVLDFDKCNFLLEELTEKDFGDSLFDLLHKKLFKAVLALEQQKKTVGLVTVLDLIEENKRAEAEKIIETGKVGYDQGVNLSSLVQHIKTKTQRVQLHEKIRKAQRALENSEEVEKVICQLSDDIDTLHVTDAIPTYTQEQLNRLLLEKLVSEPPAIFRTGLNTIDAATGGFVQKRFYLVGARTSQGKSALLLNSFVALGRQNISAAFISLEMSAVDMNKRFLCIAGEIDSSQLNYPLSREVQEKIIELIPIIEEWPLQWSDKRGMTLSDLKTKIHQFARQGAKVVFVDYVQRVIIESDEPRHLQVAKIAKTLADLADRLNIAIVAASQINRVGASQNESPELHHMAESTVLEESADVVILINRKKKEDESKGLNCPMKLNIAKNRHGTTGYHTIFFKGRQYRFSDAPFLEGPSPFKAVAITKSD